MVLSLLDLIKMSGQALWSNPTRSLLTTLGTFIGVAAINATLQVGNISRGMIQRQIDRQEAPHLRTGIQGESTIHSRDIEWLKARLPNVEAIAGNAFYDIGVAKVGDRSSVVVAQAVDKRDLQVSGREVIQGSFFVDEDFSNFRTVAIIDESLAEELFPQQNAIGQLFFFENIPYRVVGLIEAKPIYTEGEVRRTLLVPLSLYHGRIGNKSVGWLKIRPHRLEQLKDWETRVPELMEQRFSTGAWSYNNAEDILRQQEAMAIMERGLLAVGAIALLISGVGIANITVASTLERTREIGLKRAIGATPEEILWQFVLEAILISLMGGTIAIAIVHGTTQFVAGKFELPYQFEIRTAGLTLGVALCVGVGASYFPARHASRVDPITALRDR